MNKVYEAIAAVQGELSQIGIAKNRKNKQGEGYMFRGIDDVYGALAPLLSKHKLCVLPRIIERECIERTSKNGNALFYTTVTAEFDLVSAEDSSMHTVRSYGESMDSGDKGTNKAMSTAYKTMAFMAFCIPTEGDHDTENQTHEVKPQKQQRQPQQQQQQQQQQQRPTQQQPTKEPATQEQIAKIHDLMSALMDRDGGTQADILKTISHFVQNEKEYFLTPETLAKNCSKGWAVKIIGKAEGMLKPPQ